MSSAEQVSDRKRMKRWFRVLATPVQSDWRWLTTSPPHHKVDLTELAKENGGWTLSQERAFVEDLLMKRLTVLLTIFGVVVGGAIQTRGTLFSPLILAVGSILCWPMKAAVLRAQFKLELCLSGLHQIAGHPVRWHGKQARNILGPEDRSAMGHVGRTLPIICAWIINLAAILALAELVIPRLYHLAASL